MSSPSRHKSMGERALREFLSDIKCYDLVPVSSKVLACDMDISLRLAFYAFVEHGMFAAVLWDSREGIFSGMLTTSDFVHLFRHYRPASAAAEALSKHSIRSWRETVAGIQAAAASAPSKGWEGTLAAGDLGLSSTPVAAAQATATPTLHRKQGSAHVDDSGGAPAPPSHLICVSPEDTLLHACAVFAKFDIHRLPVVYEPEQSVLCVLTHRAVLRHVVEFFQPTAEAEGEAKSLSGFFQRTAHKLGIGTYSSVATLPDSTLLVDVLTSMAAQNVSAIPLTNAAGGVVDIFTREDVMLLALHEDLAALQQPVAQLKMAQRDIMRGDTELVTCSRTDSMQHLLQLFGTTGVHRVVEVDTAGKCTGIVSLSDLFGYLQGFMQAVADEAGGGTPGSHASRASQPSAAGVHASPALHATAPTETAAQQEQLGLADGDTVLD